MISQEDTVMNIFKRALSVFVILCIRAAFGMAVARTLSAQGETVTNAQSAGIVVPVAIENNGRDGAEMKWKGAIFDVDGTLLDSMWIWDSMGEDYLRSLGIEPKTDIREKLRPMSLYQAACYFRSEYGICDSAEQIMDGVNRRIAHFYTEEVLPKYGAEHFLSRLKASGVNMCIATATDIGLIEVALERCGMAKYFSKIFTCAMVGEGKDSPAIYDASLAFLSTAKKETIVFEDALHAAKTAKAAGYTVAAVYDASEPGQKELAEIADYYLKDYKEAEGLLI